MRFICFEVPPALVSRIRFTCFAPVIKRHRILGHDRDSGKPSRVGPMGRLRQFEGKADAKTLHGALLRNRYNVVPTVESCKCDYGCFTTGARTMDRMSKKQVK